MSPFYCTLVNIPVSLVLMILNVVTDVLAIVGLQDLGTALYNGVSAISNGIGCH